MKILLLILIATQVFSLDLKEGDILLQPLHCRLCNLIEAQTNSEYSHIGIYLGDGEVAEAFISVRRVSLKEFMKKTQKNLKVKVIRPSFSTPNLKELFVKKYEGLSYDNSFLWNNFDLKGEKIYCSELVYKMLEPYSGNTPYPVPMSYNVNREQWYKFFKGNIPDGKIGISPAAFDYFYETVGFLSK